MLTILYHSKFAREYRRLPVDLKRLAEEREEMFRADPFDPRLKTHKLQGSLKDFWAFSINYRYRVVFDFLGENTVRFYAVGDHSVYEL